MISKSSLRQACPEQGRSGFRLRRGFGGQAWFKITVCAVFLIGSTLNMTIKADDDSGLSGGQIAGIVVGSLLAGYLLLTAAKRFLLSRERKTYAQENLFGKSDSDIIKGWLSQVDENDENNETQISKLLKGDSVDDILGSLRTFKNGLDKDALAELGREVQFGETARIPTFTGLGKALNAFIDKVANFISRKNIFDDWFNSNGRRIATEMFAIKKMALALDTDNKSWEDIVRQINGKLENPSELTTYLRTLGILDSDINKIDFNEMRMLVDKYGSSFEASLAGQKIVTEAYLVDAVSNITEEFLKKIPPTLAEPTTTAPLTDDQKQLVKTLLEQKFSKAKITEENLQKFIELLTPKLQEAIAAQKARLELNKLMAKLNAITVQNLDQITDVTLKTTINELSAEIKNAARFIYEQNGKILGIENKEGELINKDGVELTDEQRQELLNSENLNKIQFKEEVAP